MWDGFVAKVEVVCEQKSNRAHMVTKLKKINDLSNLHNELGHPLEEVTEATGMAMVLKVTGTFEYLKLVPLGKFERLG